jgi:rhodanese-related sulfurtransferase
VARTLIKAGRARVCALEGGFEAWEEGGFPTQPIEPAA